MGVTKEENLQPELERFGAWGRPWGRHWGRAGGRAGREDWEPHTDKDIRRWGEGSRQQPAGNEEGGDLEGPSESLMRRPLVALRREGRARPSSVRTQPTQGALGSPEVLKQPLHSLPDTHPCPRSFTPEHPEAGWGGARRGLRTPPTALRARQH